jgi:hypothetical protein
MRLVFSIAAAITFLAACSSHHHDDNDSVRLELPAPPQGLAYADTQHASPDKSGQAR